MLKEEVHTYLIDIRGLVQGVGFRPFIYRLAKSKGLKGWVRNTNENVLVTLNTTTGVLESFIEDIRESAPLASEISSIEYFECPPGEFKDFRIIDSENTSSRITEISPDIAVCSDCLNDMETQSHRIHYPFLNCTNCGPRFTIITDLPYDRENTTMDSFVMCEQCRSEFEDVHDRRFHAQPVACNSCGPHYELLGKSGKIVGTDKIIKETVSLIDAGGIIAVKGMGGYFLACDALNEDAVFRLRNSKQREGKPFAVMFRDLDAIKQYADIDPAEEEMLNSWRRPIVILKEKKKLAPGVSEGLKTIGSMLPYMPFHYLLFHKLKTPVMVFTSGNVSDEPIIIDDESALRFLGPVSDAILSYNRQIYNRTDDSVMISVSGSPRIIRRSRGYVPNPVRLGFSVDGILATGAELVNCFCIGKGHNAIISQHIGDLKNYETYAFYKESIDRFSKAFRFKPDLIACDIHPDYLSTRYAMETGIRMTGIQHHHAHIASVLAENNLVEKVIGVSFDGTGLGDDGRIWGGEFLICDLIEYERYTHFRYIPMPGGDAVTYEPWRMAVSYLYNIYGIEFLNFDLDFLKKADRKSVSLVFQMLDRNINCPLTSSCGRLFDAVSALLNICTHSTFHAEAPMRLENEIDHNEQGYYVAEISDTIDFRPVIRMIIRDLQEKIPVSVISARFHNTIVAVVETIAGDIVKKTGLTKIVLSGGVFQNRYLSGKMEQKLRNAGFIVYINRLTPANDGGIALGQLAIAAKRGIPGIL